MRVRNGRDSISARPCCICAAPGWSMASCQGRSGLLTGAARRRPHLPDRVMAVRVSERAGEQIPVERPPDVARDRVAEPPGVERDRMVLVDRLAVEHGLGRRAVVVDPGLVVTAGELNRVSVLPHVEVEPLVVMEPRRRAVAARGMERHQVRAAVAGAEAARHGPDDLEVRGGHDRAVAAEDPDDVRRVLVALAQPRAVGLGVLRREDLGPDAAIDVPLVTPRRQEPDVEPERSRLPDDEVDVVPVVVVRAVLDVGGRRVVVGERPMAVGIGLVQAVELRERDRLDDREPLLGPLAQVPAARPRASADGTAPTPCRRARRTAGRRR